MPNRYMCQVLDELKELIDAFTFPDSKGKYMKGLVEEIRSMGQRMEAKLEDQSDIELIKTYAQLAKHELENPNISDEAKKEALSALLRWL